MVEHTDRQTDGFHRYIVVRYGSSSGHAFHSKIKKVSRVG